MPGWPRRRDGLLFVDDTLTGEHYGEQIEGLAKYRDVTQPGRAYIYSHCLVNLHYGHELSQRERRQTGQKHGWVEYWLDFRLYRREAELAEHGLGEQFRTKPQLLIELLRAQDWQRLPSPDHCLRPPVSDARSGADHHRRVATPLGVQSQ